MAEQHFVPGLIFRRLDNRSEPKPHPWVVLSDPLEDPESVILVNLTDGERWGDPACEIGGDEHPAIKKRSRVAYRLAEILSLRVLTHAREDGFHETLGILSPELLLRIRRGAWESEQVPDEVLDILADQGFGSDL